MSTPAPHTGTTLCIWLGSKSLENFSYGRRSHTWGFHYQPTPEASSCDYVLFGSRLFNGSNRNARVSERLWHNEGLADLVLGTIDGGMYSGTAVHWPDEALLGEVIYPYRFGFSELCVVSQVRLNDTIGRDATAAMQRAAVSGRAAISELTINAILDAAGVELPDTSSGLDLSRTPGLMADEVADDSLVAPRTVDPRLRE